MDRLKNLEYGDVESILFLAGFTAGVMVMSILFVSGMFYTPESNVVSDDETLSAQEVGEKTVEMVNRRILHNTPNNVTAEFIEAETAEAEGLPDFYKVTLRVENPTTEETTEVFTKKNGELVFLQFPRYFDAEKWEAQRHH